MTRFNIRTKGTRGVLAKLATVDDGLQREVLETAVRVGSQIVEGDARRRAPRDTGRLQRAIKSETVEVSPGRALARVYVGREAFYARFVEFGTRNMPAKPFLRPALRENRGRVMSAVRSTIGRILNRRAGI